MEYLLTLTFFLCLSVFLELKYHVRLYQSRRERLFIPIIFFMVGTAWDSFAVARGHWYFNFDNLVGIKIGLLPIEEYLFFLVMPYLILILYRVLKLKI